MFPLILAMHLPDGFLSLPVALIAWGLSAAALIWGLRALNQQANDSLLPLVGVLAAAIFAAQMLNFPIAGGTSGHLLGAALATFIVGPWAAMLIMTTVVGVQALFFQDGGLLVLGANLLNMAIIGVWVAYAVRRWLGALLSKPSWGEAVATFVAAWASIFIAALACALELAFSGTINAAIAVPAMGSIHALIGLVEGTITLGALAFLRAARPHWVETRSLPPSEQRIAWVGGTLITLALLVAAPLASSWPDGLERVAEDHGFIERATQPLYHLFSDYTLPGLENPALSTILAGLVGALLVLGVSLFAFRLHAHRPDSHR